jgi:hypothetical protein
MGPDGDGDGGYEISQVGEALEALEFYFLFFFKQFYAMFLLSCH